MYLEKPKRFTIWNGGNSYYTVDMRSLENMYIKAQLLSTGDSSFAPMRTCYFKFLCVCVCCDGRLPAKLAAVNLF